MRGLVALAMVGLLMWFRRWRHLIMFLVGLAVLGSVAEGASSFAARPRPFDVEALAYWEGYSAPSLAIAALTAVLIGITYTLVVPGPPRRAAKLVTAVIVAVVGLARIQLGIDHLTDVIFGAILGVAIPVAIFRAFVPNQAFPVAYGPRGKTAHLDVGGRRGEAIRHAVQDQIGLTINDMKLIGLEGSGGSTPLKLEVTDEDGVDRSIFAKLYAKNHVRADRWYKLGRFMLYGRMEDERPFQSVRRFVEYEDYTLRLLGDFGIATPEPYGVVEITPELEYLIAMQFFEDAVEIGEAVIDERIIDEGLQLVRRMWDVGIAHREHQAGQPHGPGRAPEGDRRVLRPGSPFAVAPGRRSRQHDARPRPAVRHPNGVRAGAQLLHARRALRGVRRGARGGQPEPASIDDEA